MILRYSILLRCHDPIVLAKGSFLRKEFPCNYHHRDNYLKYCNNKKINSTKMACTMNMEQLSCILNNLIFEKSCVPGGELYEYFKR
jgi:hypothetical protein